MAIPNAAKEEFDSLLEDIVKAIKKNKAVTKGKTIHLRKWSDKWHNKGQIRRSESLFDAPVIAEANLHVNEGVSIKVYEEPAYAPVEKVADKYEKRNKFTEINVYTEYRGKEKK